MNTMSPHDSTVLSYHSALAEAIRTNRERIKVDLQALADSGDGDDVLLHSYLVPIGMGAGIHLLVALEEGGRLQYVAPLATTACVDELRQWLAPRRGVFGPADIDVLPAIQVEATQDGWQGGLEVIGPKNRISVSHGHGLTHAICAAWPLLAVWPGETDLNAVVAAEGDEDVGDDERHITVYLDGKDVADGLIFMLGHAVVPAQYVSTAQIFLEHLLRQDARCIGYRDIYRDCATDDERNAALQSMATYQQAMIDAKYPVEDDAPPLS